MKLAIFSVLLVCLAGCQPDSIPVPKNQEPRTELTSPITGTPVPETESRPVMMVMINNHPHARPQSGLYLADVVVEILAEGEISRFAAFYYDHLEGTVGPVRSVRDYYLDLADGSGAVVAHAGGSPSALDRIRNEKSSSIDGVHQDEKHFTRVSFRKSPHNLYADLEVLRQVAADKKFPAYDGKQAYLFSRSAATGQGQTAEKIELIYHKLYKAGYQYDRASKAYIRYTEGERQTDRETETPLAMQNVLVVFAKHQVIDYAGHRDVDITGSGKGYLMQQGKAVPIEWKFRNGWIVPYSNGKEIALLPGKTWVNVLPLTGKVFFQ
ncbi:DUF3048 domain-containing protein [Thermoactinomyces mirandus]|nr:DUF3048 domain-containing protein [Thermoactinomyces mirandus]